jgi:hypothetical protein
MHGRSDELNHGKQFVFQGSEDFSVIACEGE